VSFIFAAMSLQTPFPGDKSRLNLEMGINTISAGGLAWFMGNS
jgi:hypothetical protein